MFDDISIINMIVMVKTIYVRDPTMARLATVLVLLSIGNTPALRVTLASDGNLNSIVTWCSYSAKIKLQFMKNTFHVAHFHFHVILLTRNLSKGVRVINILGRLGTGVTLAPVLCFKPAVNRQAGFRRWDS